MNIDVAEPLEVLQQVVSALKQAEVPYLIGGSFASGIHGKARSTQDLDILCDFRSSDLEKFISLVEPYFFIDEDLFRTQVRRKESVNIIHIRTMFKVDLFTRIGDFEEEQLKRTLAIDPFSSGFLVNFASAEDTILAKLRWYQLGNQQSSYQWKDLQGVVNIQQDNLDIDYLKTWAARLQVSELLSKLLESKIS